MNSNSESNSENCHNNLFRIRHSLAHVLAQAVLAVRPGSKLGFGPPIDDGFYYDFILSEPINEEHFKEIEKKMQHIIRQNQKFVREDLEISEAYKRLETMGEPYKREYAAALKEKNNLTTISFYQNGSFLDMCEGPHVESTKEIPEGCFKIRSIAGAYWRGDSKNQMMTRIYVWAFESKEQLKAHIDAYEEALRRDHKKLGKELDLFHIDDVVGKGLPLWLPYGTTIRSEVEKFMQELEFQDDYQKVSTPHIAKAELYYQTGHLPYYKEHIFPIMEITEKHEDTDEVSEEKSGSESNNPHTTQKKHLKEAYCLRPMNCPHHHKIFASSPRSYRDLPLRLSEYGQVYRYEDSGTLTGLARVRGMCTNDAHIYCTEDQIKSEFIKVMKMTETLYNTLGLKNYYMRFSTWDPKDPKGKEKYINNPEAWEKSQKLVYEAMIESGLPFKEGRGEAAFYGPKIDVQFKLVTGREETISTNQLDFAIPERLDLKYTDSQNKELRPYIIHRAPASTHERFTAFLIEHFGGAFPSWLAPIQVKIITISAIFDEYALSLVKSLKKDFIRAELDSTDDTLNKKIRNATKRKIPNVLVIGENEVKSESVTLRKFGVNEQKTLSFKEFHAWIKDEINERKLPESFLNNSKN